MPASSELSAQEYMRLLILGPPKVGKTYTTLLTCHKPAVVICTDGIASLGPASRAGKFDYENVDALDHRLPNQMEGALRNITAGVKEGRYKTVILDTLSTYARHLASICEDATRKSPDGPSDGRRFWPDYTKKLLSVIDRLVLLPAHVIVLSHHQHVGGAIDGQTPKSGPGIVPGIPGSPRESVPAVMNDVVFFEKRPNGDRVFVTSMSGVFGPGCRSLQGVEEIPADIREFWKRAHPEKPKKKTAIEDSEAKG